MSTAYAVLGATGSTGSNLVTQLSSRGESVHAYARNADRLRAFTQTLPQSSREKVKPFTGSMAPEVIEQCIDGAQVIFLVVAQNRPQPRVTVTNDAAHLLVRAIESKRTVAPSYRPLVVLLSSISLNRHALESTPRIAHWAIFACLGSVYKDVEDATTFLSSKGQEEILRLAVIQPGGLVPGTLSSSHLSETSHSTIVTYADLANAMISASERDDSGNYVWSGKEAGVVVRTPGAPWKLLSNIFNFIIPGFLLCLMPTLWHVGDSQGWW